MNKRMKLNKGITLIALIITIIVLLILAGVTITMLTGENGILNRAVTAREETQKAEMDEKVKLAILASIGTDGKVDFTKLQTELEKQGITDIEVGEDILKVTTDNKEYTIAKDGTIQEKETTGEETPPEDTEVMKNAKAAMPAGAHIDTNTNENTGIVMIDSNENEWVWIEVPSDVFTTATSSTDYNAIKADLITYATDYREGKVGQGYNWTDEWYAKDGNTFVTASTEGLTDTQKLLNNGCGLTYDEYQTAYNTMLSSVYNNKGFYISRYEIGDKESTESNTIRTRSTGVANTPVSKQDQIPYNFITCSQAQGLANGMSTGTKTSSLMFGIQWDLVCKYLEVESDLEIADINSDSISWGNHSNSSLKLDRGKYNIAPNSSSGVWTEYNVDTENYVTASQTSSNKNYKQLLTTGASNATNKLNIYDFAGNEFEWTLEHATTNSSTPCSYRGGIYSSSGSSFPASYRSYDSTTSSGSIIAFRSTLY